MQRRTFLLAAPAVALAGCAGATDTGGPAAARPAWRVGDRWTYHCSDGYRVPVTWTEFHEVTVIDATGIAVRVTASGETMNFSRVELYSAPGTMLVGAVYDNAETRRFRTPLTLYRFPLTPGTGWDETVANYDELTQREDSVNRYVRVGGYETVATPAGAYRAVALRVFMNLNVDDPFRLPTRCNYAVWWAPDVGAMVRETKSAAYIERGGGMDAAQVRTQFTVTELTSFRRGPG
jgi:hypothetical protein